MNPKFQYCQHTSDDELRDFSLLTFTQEHIHHPYLSKILFQTLANLFMLVSDKATKRLGRDEIPSPYRSASSTIRIVSTSATKQATRKGGFLNPDRNCIRVLVEKPVSFEDRMQISIGLCFVATKYSQFLYRDRSSFITRKFGLIFLRPG